MLAKIISLLILIVFVHAGPMLRERDIDASEITKRTVTRTTTVTQVPSSTVEVPVEETSVEVSENEEETEAVPPPPVVTTPEGLFHCGNITILLGFTCFDLFNLDADLALIEQCLNSPTDGCRKEGDEFISTSLKANDVCQRFCFSEQAADTVVTESNIDPEETEETTEDADETPPPPPVVTTPVGLFHCGNVTIRPGFTCFDLFNQDPNLTLLEQCLKFPDDGCQKEGEDFVKVSLHANDICQRFCSSPPPDIGNQSEADGPANIQTATSQLLPSTASTIPVPTITPVPIPTEQQGNECGEIVIEPGYICADLFSSNTTLVQIDCPEREAEDPTVGCLKVGNSWIKYSLYVNDTCTQRCA
eukprot:Awhi_evm1s258